MGDVSDRFSPAAVEKVLEQGGGGDAIGIVITENKDFFPVNNGPGQAMGSAMDVGHRFGWPQMAQAWIQEVVDIVGIAISAVDQYGRSGGQAIELAAQPVNELSVGRLHVPWRFHGAHYTDKADGRQPKISSPYIGQP